MQFSPLLLAGLGFVGVLAGRLLFDRWVNHLSLYSFIWGTGLALFEARLLDYALITGEVWMLIGCAWIAFVLGAATLAIARTAVGAGNKILPGMATTRNAVLERRAFTIAIVILSAIALISTLRRWSILIDMFGDIPGVLFNGYKIYRMRIEGKLTGVIPYLNSFALAAIYLGGVYSARESKIKLIALLPMLVIMLDDIAQAGRAKMLMGGILFSSAYFIAKPASARQTAFRAIGKTKQLLIFAFLLTVLLVVADFVRSYRGSKEEFYGASKELRQFDGSAFLTPSIYLYLSSHPGVFNAYWKAGGEHPFPGSNTFAPIFRILARVGLAETTPHFSKFYNMPIQSNTGTYLRELHADFGIAGILVTPYVIGLFCTALWFRIKRRPTLPNTAVLTHMYVMVAFSYLYQVTRVGEWTVSLIVALVASYFIDRRCAMAAAKKQQYV